MTLAAVLCCTMTMMVQTSCTNEDVPVPITYEPGDLAECTILYYGTGGGNADRFLLYSLISCQKANPESFEHVNFVVQYKFSTAANLKQYYKLSDEMADKLGSNTIRWAVEPNDTPMYVKAYDPNASFPFYGEYNADMTNPDSLTNFINWAAQAYPAKKYMVILADHGGGYLPDDDLPESTESAALHRGAIYDDGHGSKHFTVKSLPRALRQADVYVETLMFQACLMNTMEDQFELKDVVDYVVASTYTMQSNVSFNALIDELAKPQTTEEALAAFCKINVEGWEPGGDEPYYSDMTVTRTSSLNQLGVMMCEFTDRLCNTYTNGTDEQRQKIDSCTALTIKVDKGLPSYDAAKYLSSLMGALPEVYNEQFVMQFADAFNTGLVAQNYSRYLTAHNYQVDYSIMIGADDAYLYVYWNEKDGNQLPYAADCFYADGKKEVYYLKPLEDDPSYYQMVFNHEADSWGSTFVDTYEQLEFDRMVGWSRWIKINRQQPSLFCPHDLKFELSDGDVSGNTQL